MNEQTNELLSCPFCGAAPELVAREEGPLLRGAYVICNECKTSNAIFTTAAEAIAAWNRRAALASRQVPEGWVLVPATDLPPAMMARAFHGLQLGGRECTERYLAMLEVAPKAPGLAASPSSPSTGKERPAQELSARLATASNNILTGKAGLADANACIEAAEALAASPSADARALLEAKELLRIWQTYLGSSRQQCDDAGKRLWDRIEAVCASTPAPQADLAQQLADMQARKDGAYEERNKVVAALAKLFPSGVARTAIPGWSEDWHGCVYIDLPTGQVSWHFHDSQAHLFVSLPPYTQPWDGHDTPEKYRRLAALSTPAPAATEMPLDRVRAIEDAIDRIERVINAKREPGWSYRNTITTNRNVIREECQKLRAMLAASTPATTNQGGA